VHREGIDRIRRIEVKEYRPERNPMHIHDRGLGFDLATLRNRRRALALFGGAGLAVLAGCSSNGAPTSSVPAATTAPGTTAPGTPAATPGSGNVDAIPQETAGPFPGDGSNGPNVLTESGIVRSDIRSSFGSGSAVAAGVPLTIKLTVLDAAKDTALAGAAVYLWHCDQQGRYSLYSAGTTGENYLRGVQAADGSGTLTFTSIFPAAYQGRWPHIHFEIYPSLAEATKAGTKLTTSQLALPEEVCRTVYGTDGYSSSVRNLAQTSLNTDMVFRDGWDHQLANVSGDVTKGLTAALTIGV
jgi:protocatechuate 3,4-dioxygenase beta subunit